jgi:hypothetical protein
MDSPTSPEDGAFRRDATLFEFPPDVLQRIRAILGPHETDLVLPRLRRAATFYIYARQRDRSLSGAQKQLARLATVLARVQMFRKTLSLAALYTLRQTYDFQAIETGEPAVTGDEVLLVAIAECDRALNLVQRALKKKPNNPKVLFAVGIAVALGGAQQRLSKGADGLFARVLTEVWFAVDPDGWPKDVTPYVRQAVDLAVRHNPELRAPRGRPHKRRTQTP